MASRQKYVDLVPNFAAPITDVHVNANPNSVSDCTQMLLLSLTLLASQVEHIHANSLSHLWSLGDNARALLLSLTLLFPASHPARRVCGQRKTPLGGAVETVSLYVCMCACVNVSVCLCGLCVCLCAC